MNSIGYRFFILRLCFGLQVGLILGRRSLILNLASLSWSLSQLFLHEVKNLGFLICCQIYPIYYGF